MGNKDKGILSQEIKSKIDVRTYTMIAALVVLWIFFSMMTGGKFILTRNISNLTRQMATVGILGTGMVLVIVSGGIDLSVGSILGFLGGIAAAMMAWYEYGTFATILVVLLGGALLGLIQGSVIAYSGVPPFIVTLGGMLVFRGGVIGVTRGVSIAPLKPSFVYLGQAYIDKTVGLTLAAIVVIIMLILTIRKRNAKVKYGFSVVSKVSMFLKWLIFSIIVVGSVLILNDYEGIPVPVLLMVALVVVFTFIAEKTTFGRSIYAIGGNIEAARYSGINVKRNLLSVYILMGVMSAIGGIVLAARLNAGTPQAGTNMELDAIASAVIGGTSMSGGSGRIAGAILGALFMATIDNGMSMMNMDAFWQYIVKGIILVAAVWFDIRMKKVTR